MRSEYIPRLREELVAAATRERAGLRHRPRLRPQRLVPVLATAAVVAAVIAALLVVELPRDETPVAPAPAATALTYRVTPVAGTDAAAAAQESADVLRERFAAAGIRGATVTVAGDRIAVDPGSAAPGEVAALTVPGELRIFDWEASVLGPSGRPEPGDSGVSGGENAGTGGAVSRAEAARRAARADRPSARIMRAGATAGRWYALDVRFAIDNADIASPRAQRDPRTGEPIVAFEFDALGQRMFSRLTREVARRGADRAALTGLSPIAAAQHIAIVLDDRIVSMPFIDFQVAPDGLDGAGGAQIAGGFTPDGARQTAAILDSGPLPAKLEAIR